MPERGVCAPQPRARVSGGWRGGEREGKPQNETDCGALFFSLCPFLTTNPAKKHNHPSFSNCTNASSRLATSLGTLAGG